MIKGEREYAVTRSWAEKFEAAMAGIDARLKEGGPDRMLEAGRRGLQGLTDDMRRDIAEYEALGSGRVPPADAGNLEELPEALIKRRIGLGMTQEELAERMGMRAQDVEEYERTDYESADYARLMEAHAALSPGAAREGTGRWGAPSEARVLSRIKAAGLGGRFVDECIVVWPCARGEGAAGAVMYERKLLSRIYKIYGWTPGMLAGSAPLEGGPSGPGSGFRPAPTAPQSMPMRRTRNTWQESWQGHLRAGTEEGSYRGGAPCGTIRTCCAGTSKRAAVVRSRSRGLLNVRGMQGL